MLTAGRRLDRYEIIAEIGAGAFGVVYRARHLDMLREDAVKVPHDPEYARQFMGEARLVALLNHPNIVRIHWMNAEWDPPYIGFELVEGTSLRERMTEADGPMDCDEVVEIARQVLEGLAAAHEAGIVHRDLKPENILIATDGTVKISDFGLGFIAGEFAKQALRSLAEGAAMLSHLHMSRATQEEAGASFAGTLAYMSPEQEDAVELDGRSDLYALGVVMYETLTGIRPRGRFKDPKDLNEAVPQGLNDLIIRALEVERGDRYEFARTMSAALVLAQQDLADLRRHREQARQETEHRREEEARERERQRQEQARQEAERRREEEAREQERREQEQAQAALLPTAGTGSAPAPEATDQMAASAWPIRVAPPSASPGGVKPWEQPAERTAHEVAGPAGVPLVWVRAGSFLMGSTPADINSAVRRLSATKESLKDEQPAHRVELSGFWIGKTEVTVAQWRSVMGSVPDGQQADDHPVVNVSWNDAREFCVKLELELPTEAQWEYAARGPDSRCYPWGVAWDNTRCCNEDNPGPDGTTFPVGSLPAGASWCGALDMAGNVWEWCADWYSGGYYASSPAKDPPGPSNGGTRVLRGGSWFDDALKCRASYRTYHDPTNTLYLIGFRVARSFSR